MMCIWLYNVRYVCLVDIQGILHVRNFVYLDVRNVYWKPRVLVFFTIALFEGLDQRDPASPSCSTVS